MRPGRRTCHRVATTSALAAYIRRGTAIERWRCLEDGTMPRLIDYACLSLLLVTPLVASGAQNVRGLVTEQASGTPLAGVLISLSDDTSGVAAATTLTNDRGAYLLRAPQPGRYRLGAKRIGVRRFESEPMELVASQDVERNVELEALAFKLPTV